METWNFGGPFGPVVAHSGPSGPCQSLSLVLLPLTTTCDSSVAHLGPIFGHFSIAPLIVPSVWADGRGYTPRLGLRNPRFRLRVWISGWFWCDSDGPGHSRKVRESPGQKLKKVETKFKFQKCERFSTIFRSVNDFLQFSIFPELRDLGLRVSISYIKVSCTCSGV